MSTTACILANLSMQLGRSLQWDHAKGIVVGDEEANRLLRRPYRAPWVHPEPAQESSDNGLKPAPGFKTGAKREKEFLENTF